MRRVAWVLLLIYVFTIPWEYSLDLGAPLGNIARIVGLLLLVVAIPAVLQASKMRTPNAVQRLVLAMFLWFACTCFWTLDAPTAAAKMRGYAQEMMIVWFLLEFTSDQRDLRTILRMWLAGSWVLAALTIADAGAMVASQVRFAAVGQDPNDVARFLDLGFPIAALLVDWEAGWLGRALAIGYFPLGVAAVLLTASRGGFMAALVAIIGCAAVFYRSHFRAVIFGFFGLPIVATLLWFITPHETLGRLATISDQLQGGDLNQRLNIWEAGWHAFVSAPFLGHGVGSFVSAARLGSDDTAHNTALSILVETGICGFSLAFAIVAVSMHSILRMRGMLRTALMTLVSVWLVSSLVGTVFESRTTWLMFGVIAVAARLTIHPMTQFVTTSASTNALLDDADVVRARKALLMNATSISISGGSINRRILSAAAAVTAAGVIVKMVATFKEITVAGIYGRSDAMDAYLAAILIPGLMINLIAESMNQALTPTLIRVRETEGHARAQELLSNAMLWACGLLILVSAIMALSARGIFSLTASHFAPEKMNLAIHLFYALLPIVLLTGIASNCTAVLNTVERFAVPAIVPVTTSLTIIGCSLFVGAQIGIWAIIYGTLAGALVQAIWMGWLTNRNGYRPRLRWYGMNKATREVAHQYGPVLLSSVVASGGLLVDQSMAAMLPAGSVSALAYATRFVSVVVALLAGAVSSALTPYLSSMVAKGDWSGCRQTVRHWTQWMALVSVPIAVILIAAAHSLVRLTLQHGRFGPQDTAVVTEVMIMSAIQIPFYVCSRVPYRLILAMRRTDLIFYCGLLNLALDIVLNIVLMRRFGVAGIALATSLWCMTTFIFLAYWSHKLLNAKAN